MSEFVFPASFAQQRLWLLDQLLPGNTFYNVHAAAPMDVRLDRGTLAKTLDDLIVRHETLRTCFAVEDYRPMQVISTSVETPLRVLDLRHLSEDEQREWTLSEARQDPRTPFDLTCAPLLRVTLVQRSAGDVLLICMHHTICDGWSIGVFFRELQEVYAAHISGRVIELPPLPIQYADFAVWQHGYLSGDVLDEHLRFWTERLRGTPALELPLDFARPAIPTSAGGSQRVVIDAPLTEALLRIAREERTTLFVVLVSALAVVLHRHSSQDDFAIAVPIANRNRAELEGLIGLFVNTLVFRVALDGEPSFREIVAQMREIAIDAYAHQDLPFEKIIEALQLERDLARNPIAQVAFQIHNEPVVRGLAARGDDPLLDVHRGSANFDFVFDLWQAGDRLEGKIDYRADLFEAETIGRMIGHFRRVLEQVTENPALAIGDVDLLTSAERTFLLRECNDTSVDYPRDATIHALFERVRNDRTESIALICGDERVTYPALNARANGCARVLREHGARPGDVIAVSLRRGSAQIAVLLGILKAGCAYVAIEPDYASAARRGIADDAGARIVITRAEDADAFDGLIAIEPEFADVDRPDDADVAATELAYVAYTSGSTGRPKGVCVPHRAVVRLVQSESAWSIRADDRVLQYAPVAFDASTFEIWGPLLNGATCVIQPGGGATSIEELARTIVEQEVSVVWLTSGLFHQLVDTCVEALSGVRLVLSGGDVVSPAHVRRVLSLPGCRRFVNGYGPTENTTFTCTHVVERAEDVTAPLPIGRPVPNTRVYVLDRYGHPAPVGVSGELHAAGDGMARGYHRCDELARAAFVDDPFVPGSTMYRTGDRARVRADASIEFLGRIDRQVKVRGFRVEPGEVEAVLASHPDVRQAVVLARADGDGQKRLVAYLVAETVDVDALRGWMAERMPPYLVPSFFITLDVLPITPIGKTDYEALAAMELSRPLAVSHVPEGELQEALAGLWREVLRVPEIRVGDDFFMTHGGHSLMATQLASRIRHVFDLDFPLFSIFDASRFGEMADRIEAMLIADITADGAEVMS